MTQITNLDRYRKDIDSLLNRGEMLKLFLVVALHPEIKKGDLPEDELNKLPYFNKLEQLADELEAETFAEAVHDLPDVNGLVHAHNADSALHNSARLWRGACLLSPEGI
jgi:hypothetical protein